MAFARDVVARQTDQLIRLVDDLLDLSRITRGNITLNLSVFDVAGIIAQTVETAQPLLAERGHELSIDLPSEPLLIHGDRARVIQVLSNLLNNAAKYTKDGGRIALGVQRVGTHVVLKVTDNGIGIPPHMLERVFDMFTQVDGPGSGQGLGIGLALAKQLVAMHHGSIEARSDGPGHGSELVVRLPLAAAAEERVLPAPADDARSVELSVPHRRRVLVVDDNLDAAETLSRLLRLEEHEVLMAHDGLSGLETAQRFHPDVIFLDIAMPQLDGLEVARRLRREAASARPLLVAITGFGQAEDRARTAAAGFDHHLIKPVDPHDVLSLVRTARPGDPGTG
jgi:CheY-like chemotaxis protein/two-component sensor histidine kinase